jgi:hypothetical protein
MRSDGRSQGYHRSAAVSIVVSGAFWAVVLEATHAYGPCRSYGTRTERVSHSSLDGAQNASPTTAHRHSSFPVSKKKEQESLQ